LGDIEKLLHDRRLMPENFSEDTTEVLR
jgi:hypothetical protein